MQNETFTVSNESGFNKEHLDNRDELAEWAQRVRGKFAQYPTIKVIRDQDGKTRFYDRKANPLNGADWVKRKVKETC